MIANRSLRRLGNRREAFTLLEVLVVVAILVILAGAASIYVFKYLEDAKLDTARNTMTQLEEACKSYMVKNGGGQPPDSLQELVIPSQEGAKPYVDGGLSSLKDPWGNNYGYIRDNVDAYGSPDPMVTCTYKGTTVYSTKRVAQSR